MKECYYFDEESEICVNADCSCCADYCPVASNDYFEICKYYRIKNKTCLAYTEASGVPLCCKDEERKRCDYNGNREVCKNNGM